MKKMNPMLQGALFLILGIPGLFALLGGSFFFAHHLFRADLGPAMVALVVTILGAFGVLVGAGKTHEPAYLIVFLSFPSTIILSHYVWPANKAITVLAVAVIAIVVNVFVQRYYKGRGDSRTRQTDH